MPKARWTRITGWMLLPLSVAAPGSIPLVQAQSTVIAAPQKPQGSAPARLKPGQRDSGGHARNSQRVLLAPGCYVLSPGGSYAASAYCVDKDLPAAETGTGLMPLQASPLNGLGDTIVRAGDRTLSLQAAAASHLVAFESLGRNDYFHVSIRNLSNGRLEICVRTATVIAADSGASSNDLAPIEAKIDALLPPLKNAKLGSAAAVYGSADEQHAVIQQRLWDETAKAKQKSMLDDLADNPSPGCPRAATPMTPPTEPTLEIKCSP